MYLCPLHHREDFAHDVGVNMADRVKHRTRFEDRRPNEGDVNHHRHDQSHMGDSPEPERPACPRNRPGCLENVESKVEAVQEDERVSHYLNHCSHLVGVWNCAAMI
eukprot:COSAG05_NODE_1831_length_3999_cov_3.690256_1_plen_105_part_10